ncbi:MAG: 3-carboxy-cis,cis-muconate cycloisomerase [Candidatus Acidiferrales bacterium]
MTASSSARLLDPLFASAAMLEIFSDARRLQAILDFEAALARALVRCSIAPKSAARAIESQCVATLFSFDLLAQESAQAGNLAIPLVHALTALVASHHAPAAGFVHWGATSQDALDTAAVLQLRDALDLFDRDLARFAAAVAKIAESHAGTLLAGRTWLQQAPPVTLGLKAAGWLDALDRHAARLRAARSRALVLQFGGAVGTLAALDSRGPAVAAALAKDLNLSLPAIPWHASRDRFSEVAAVLGLLVGTLGKIARDISLLSQTEIGEALEPAAPGRGGSSTMPHKQNPVGCAVALAAAIRVPALVSTMLSAMVQEHERGLGGWHAEWQTLPEICLLASGALAQLTPVLEGLKIETARMSENLEITHGLILAEAVSFALARKIGKPQAHEIVEQACRRALAQRRHLRLVLREDQRVRPYLSQKEIVRLLDPKNYTGSARRMIKAVLAGRQPRKS